MKKLIATLLMIGITVLIGNYGFQDDESGLTKLFAIVMLWTFFFIVLIGWTFVGALLSRKKAAINGRVDLTIQEAAMAKVALRDGTISASLGFFSILPLLSSDVHFRLTFGIPALFFALASIRLFAYYCLSKNKPHKLATDRFQALLSLLTTIIFFIVISV
jgi:hypothetical protein